MHRKRALPQLTTEVLPVDYSDSFFDLDEKESTAFWNLENSIALAEVAIGKRVTKSGGVASYLTELSRIEQFVIKVFSCSIKTQTAQRSKLLDSIFQDLEDFNASSAIIDLKITHYLACCMSCSSNFSSGTRSSLLRTLAKRHLLPTTKVISNVKGGLSLFIDWLRVYNGLSKSGSDYVTDIIRELLKFQLNVARPTIEGALQSLIEQSTDFEMNCTSVLWKELWFNVSTMPSAPCKKQALALLQYAITRRPNLISCPKEIKSRLMSNAFKLNYSSERSLQGVQLTSFPKDNAMHCAELFPLILICYAENDLITMSAALHLVVNSAHASITRWTLKLKSQAPTAIWNSVLQTIIECIRTVTSTTASSKGPQYKILLALKQILDCNPFGRQFGEKCTAKESLAAIRAELNELKVSQENVIAGGQHQSENAIEFLTQEMSFVNTIQTGIHQSVLAVLVQGSVRGIAVRNMTVVDCILQSTCSGVDPGVIMKHIEGFHKDISDKIRLIVCNRSTHESGFLEIASSVLHFMRTNLQIDSSQHILKSPDYQRLQHLSTICVGGNTKADVASIVQSLLKRLRHLLDSNYNTETSSEKVSGRQETFDSIVMILLSLSVLPMDCDGKIGRTQRQHVSSLYNHFLNEMVDLKKRVLDKFTDAAMYCTAWLLFLAQAKKMTATLLLPSSKESEPNLFSERSLKHVRSLIYPDLLTDSCVMPAAILFAMQLHDPQQLLFECIGHLQDCSFGGKETDICSITHYSNLIATVILENYKIVRDLARTKVYSSVTDQSIHRFGYEGVMEPSESLAASVIGTDIASSHSIVVDTKSNDAVTADYMNAAHLQEEANQVETDDLEKSVSAKDSFLACFLPLFTKLVSAHELPEAVRLGALRTLSAYMKCSRNIFLNHIQLLEELIIHCPLDTFGNRLNHLRIESTLVWMENFTVTPLTLTIPVRAFLDYFEAIKMSTTTVDVNHRSRVDSVASSTDENNTTEQNFLITLLHCMHSLLRERKLRDEAECAVAIGLPLALASSEGIDTLQNESIKILKDVFVNYPYLFTRTLYQLCIPLQSSRTVVSNQFVSDSVSNLVEKRLDQSAKLLLIKTIIQIAQNEEELKSKIDDADRALTDEVIRSNNSFALAALKYLKMTTESADAIKEADEIGILNTLDPVISEQLRKRVGMR
jgi:hypothetical protein